MERFEVLQIPLRPHPRHSIAESNSPTPPSMNAPQGPPNATDNDATTKDLAAERRKRKAERKSKRTYTRLEARLGPTGAAAHVERRERRKERRKIAIAEHTALVNQACGKLELKRAKRAKMPPLKDSEVLDTRDLIAGILVESTHGLQIGASTAKTDANGSPLAFAGQVIIQDHLSAATQALSEQSRDGLRRKEPGRYSYYVDAAVSQGGIAGVSVVYKTHRRDMASPWTIKGYRMCGVDDQRDAEAWAVSQALHLILDRVNADKENLERPNSKSESRTEQGSRRHAPCPPKPKLRDLCSSVSIYSDSQYVLQRTRDASSPKSLAIQTVIDVSIKLEGIGVNVELHWCPGHSGVPSNVLADLVVKRARESPS
ncbi:hypothetical protein ACLMJK_008176 [Lecanora helva]